jgi:hypothetical protein
LEFSVGDPSVPTGVSSCPKTTSSSPFWATSIFDQTVSNPSSFSFTSQSNQNTSPFSSNPKLKTNLYSSVTESNPNPFSMKQSNAASFCLGSQSNQNQTQNPNLYPFSFSSQSTENQNTSPFSSTLKSKQNQNLNPFSFFPQLNPSSSANFSFTSQSNQNENPFSSFAKDSNESLFSSPFASNYSPISSSSSTSSSNLSVFGSVTTQATCTHVSGSNVSTTRATGITQHTSPGCRQQPSNGSWSDLPPFGQATTTSPTTVGSF